MTTAGPVKAAIVAALTSGVPTAQVRYGKRGPIAADDVISVRGVDVVPGQTSRATLGGQPKLHEDYGVDLIASSTRQGADAQQAATEAALALYTSAVTVLRTQTDETLGVAGVISALPGGPWSLEEPELDGEAFNGTVRFVVQVSATIT